MTRLKCLHKELIMIPAPRKKSRIVCLNAVHTLWHTKKTAAALLKMVVVGIPETCDEFLATNVLVIHSGAESYMLTTACLHALGDNANMLMFSTTQRAMASGDGSVLH